MISWLSTRQARRSASLLGSLCALAVVLAALPALASAATTYYVSPTGSGTTCSVAAPCELAHAVGAATSGDTILARGDEGTYGSVVAPSAAPIRVAAGVTLEGEPGQPMPQLYTDAHGEFGGFEVEANARLADFAIHELRAEERALLIEGEASAERVLTVNEAGGPGCALSVDSAMTDSACAGTYGLYDDFASRGAYTLKLRDDTFFGTEYGAEMEIGGVSGRMEFDVEAVNTIFLGDSGDLLLKGTNDGKVAVTASHSNYTGVARSGEAEITPAGTEGNQAAAPLLVDPAAGDLRELTGSPTIDAGLASPLNGALDLAGEARELPGTITCSGPGAAPPDIGAYEYVAAIPPCAPSGTSSTGGGTSSSPKKTPRLGAKILALHVSGTSATLRFKGTGGAKRFECRLDHGKWRSCHSPTRFHGLRPGAHTASVKAVGGAHAKFAAATKRHFHVAA